jgi:hypothetical protein
MRIKMNLVETKMMVNDVNGVGGVKLPSAVDPFGMWCDKSKTNSIICIECKKWLHSGVK